MKYFLRTLFLVISLLFFSCSKQEKVLKVAATSVPHAEILETIKTDLEKKGYRLEIIVVDDYQLPNRLLHEGHVDANFFQHLPFLEEEKKEFGYDLIPLAKTHIEPLGIYSLKFSSLENIPKKALISIPSDPANEGRALYLLEKARLITLREHSSICATIVDIEENPLSLKIKEIDAPLLPRTLNDVALSVIPGNFALQAGLSPSENGLLLEDSQSPYVNVLVIKNHDESRQELQLLAELLTSEKTSRFINEKYFGKIISLVD